MNPNPCVQWIAFAAQQQIATGLPAKVATAVKHFVDSHPDQSIMILDINTSRTVELDLRGSLQNVLEHLPAGELASELAVEPAGDAATVAAQEQARGRGRPRLGVVAREVTLLPRHWDWLSAQPGGASVALRKLVELARRSSAESDRLREATESAYRFMFALASNAPGFEEASRSLFAGNLARLELETESWPIDVRAHLLDLASRAVSSESTPANLTTQATLTTPITQ